MQNHSTVLIYFTRWRRLWARGAKSSKLTSMKIKLDQPLPPFDLPATNYRGVKSQLSNEILIDRPYLLFVYPRDNTSGCTMEAETLRDIFVELRDLGVEIYGISRDSIRSHEKFIKSSELPYSLIADDGGGTLNRWGLIYQAKMYGKPVTKTSRISVFVENGVVVQLWDKVVPSEHAAEVLAWVQQWAQKRAGAEPAEQSGV